MNREEIIIGGFGGQGIILAGFIVGKAASIFDGRNVTLNQSYGPEARGGDCHVEVVISDSQISYPYIDNPSILVVMSQEAYDKGISSLRQDAPLLIDEALVKPEQLTTNKIFAIPATSTAQELGRKDPSHKYRSRARQESRSQHCNAWVSHRRHQNRINRRYEEVGARLGTQGYRRAKHGSL